MSFRFRPGDVLLLEGDIESLPNSLAALGWAACRSPIAACIASQLGVSPDPFLMAVAVPMLLWIWPL